MTIEERLSRLEEIFESKGKLKSEADIRNKIKTLRLEEKQLTDQIRDAKSDKQRKELYIKRYRVQDFIKDLEWCFDEG